ncbi:R3HC1 protein, partial [Paradoxornis webbianus]|nr:R3HC1 protein [Sinosuthora webbiana]
TLALRSMDGVFLSPTEDEFVGRIAEELEHFMVQGQHQRVLLFPPLSSRLRYLIHRTVENMELLSSFSVGEGWRRRTVICHSAVSSPSPWNKPKVTASRFSPAPPWGRGGRGARPRHPGDSHGDSARPAVGSGRISRPPRRRPDKALHAPKGSRRKANWRERENSDDGDAAPGGESCPKNPSRREAGEAGDGPGEQREPEEENVLEKGGAERRAVRDEGVLPLGNGRDPSGRDKDCSHSPFLGHGKAPPRAGGQGSGGGKAPKEEEEEEEEEEKEPLDVPEALSLDLAAGDREGTRQRDPEDDCTAELLAEILGNLTVKEISVERVSVDCGAYGEAQLSEGDLGHVTEIYDFPPALKTEDLMGMFSDFHESGFKIQWVDDTHALGIFSSLSTASQALGRRYPCLKIRPLIHATKQSKIKALQRPKLLHLGKERPQTDAAVARRLVSHALGWRHRQQEAAGTELFQAEPLDQEE